MSTHKRLRVGTIAGALLLFLFAVIAAGAFYGFMVYQSVPEEGDAVPLQKGAEGLDPAHLLPRTSPVPGEPVPMVVLQNLRLKGNRRDETRILDQVCTQIVDTYSLEDGREIRVITAWPPAWLETLAGSGWVPQLITGFSIGSLPAVYYANGGQSMLVAREDPFVYAIQVAGEDKDGQTVYSLGVLAYVNKGESAASTAL